MFTKLFKIKKYFFNLSLPLKIFLMVILVGIGFLARQGLVTQNSKVTYQTAKAEKGTLITSISGSGTITSGNSSNLTTKVSGVVKQVYVTNGDTVTKGQKIAEVTLDEYAQGRQATAWVTYLKAVEAVKEAQKSKVTADLQMYTDRQAVVDAQEDMDRVTNNLTNPVTGKIYTDAEKAVVVKTLEEARLAFTVSETKYYNADANIVSAKAVAASALLDYQENSATIVAPSSGVISDLALAEGLIMNANSSTSSTSGATIISSQTVGKISIPDGQLIATVNLSEIDVISVKANQKVAMTLDAYSDLTFTGKVLAVNTSGSVSSGVTTYPVTILLDSVTVEVYPNMSINAEIITNMVADAIIVPTTAITTSDGVSSVQVMKDSQISTVEVEIGAANDSDTQIKSGLSEGDEVVTSVIMADDSASDDATSAFSTSNRTNSSSTRSSGTMIMQGGGPPGGF